ncbi:MAG TPA: hypothetical protein VJP60_07850 [Rhizomicrobium sp.]|nr:hypothetical protein [Rhizomicrobium sp.]
MNREVRLECIIALLAGVVAIVLASSIVAMARTPDINRHRAQNRSGVERSHPGHRLVAARPRVAKIAAGRNISRYIRPAGHRCRAQFTYCKPGAQQTAAEVVVCRPARSARGRPACTVVSDGMKRVFCQFAFACDDAHGGFFRPLRRAVVGQAAAGARVALPTGARDRNASATLPAPPLKHIAENDHPVEENSQIDATGMALRRAAQ